MDQHGGKQPGGATNARSQTDSPEIAVSSRDGVRVVEIVGDQDVTTVGQVRAAIYGGDAPDPAGVVISLERVTFIDSAIVGVLFTSSRRLQENGVRVVIHCPVAAPIGQVLRLAALHKIVGIVGTLDEAIKRVAAPDTPAPDTEVSR